MLTPEQIAALRDRAGRIVDPINDYLIREIARRISEAGQLTSTAAYQVWRAQNLGLSRREIKKRLEKELRQSSAEIEKLLTQAAEVGYNFDLSNLPTASAIPFAENESLQQMVAAAVKLAQEDFTNLTQTLGMVDPYGKALPLQDAYRRGTDFAFEQVFTGATDYNTAIRRATKNLADLGIRVIDYESGVHTSLEAAVRRNIMGGLGLMQERISQQNHDTLGADGWEISAHAASAPDHEPIQGKQYSDKDFQALNNSLQRRIGTLNCGHAAFPIILGVSSPQYTSQELRKFQTDNAKGVGYEGRQYTMYEATQKQRQVERAIRRQKNRILASEAAGDQEKLLTDRIRLTRLNQEYNRFSRATDLPTQRERAQVAGFGRDQAAGAAAVANDLRKWEAMRDTIGKNAPQSLADYITIKYTDSKEWGRLMENKRLFEKIDTTGTYSMEYRERLKNTYQYFQDSGFTFREHALNRVLGQKNSAGKIHFSNEDLLTILKRPPNYQQPDGKLVRFYDRISVISASDTGEIVSVVVRNAVRKDWKAL